MKDRGRPVGGGDVGSRGVGSGSRYVGGRGVGWLAVGGIDGFAGVHNVGHIAAVGVRHVVVHGLQAAVGQNDGVGTGGGVAVALLAGIDLDAVVVVHGVVVGVNGRRIIGRLLVGGGGIGRGGGVGGGSRGVAVTGCVISGRQGSDGQNNEDLRSETKNL